MPIFPPSKPNSFFNSGHCLWTLVTRAEPNVVPNDYRKWEKTRKRRDPDQMSRKNPCKNAYFPNLLLPLSLIQKANASCFSKKVDTRFTRRESSFNSTQNSKTTKENEKSKTSNRELTKGVYILIILKRSRSLPHRNVKPQHQLFDQFAQVKNRRRAKYNMKLATICYEPFVRHYGQFSIIWPVSNTCNRSIFQNLNISISFNIQSRLLNEIWCSLRRLLWFQFPIFNRSLSFPCLYWYWRSTQSLANNLDEWYRRKEHDRCDIAELLRFE